MPDVCKTRWETGEDNGRSSKWNMDSRKRGGNNRIKETEMAQIGSGNAVSTLEDAASPLLQVLCPHIRPKLRPVLLLFLKELIVAVSPA
jgi:hypothetical protein